jgi:hypothetical protein
MGQTSHVRLTDFWERMDATFGTTYARSWAHDVVVADLGMTVDDALAAGIETITVWRAVCAIADVPSVLR